MGYRRFTDRDGVTWEVRERSIADWVLEPVSQPGLAPVRIRAPAHEHDPFEVSTVELQRLLDAERPRGPTKKSPFRD